MHVAWTRGWQLIFQNNLKDHIKVRFFLEIFTDSVTIDIFSRNFHSF